MLNLIKGRVSRRDFLRVGTMGVSGYTLANLAAAQRQEPLATITGKAIIMVYLPGGPSHIDMFDMKPQAPAKLRRVSPDPVQCIGLGGLRITSATESTG